ncbi:hypothetical protein BX666DRAFT_1854837 [Dichotomocladium elegans]|nr:hypothetical protein BX666DRAFT_1854837 [Dichotomocladium elegans]
MPPSTAELLSSLKSYSKCTDDLAFIVRATLLKPFETSTNTSRPTNLTRAQLKALTTRLAPFAMRVVNQNIESLRNLKNPGDLPQSQYNTVVNCLISTAKYALIALEHMNAFTTLKPLDLEKLMSNLISKIVDLKEYARALDELCALRKSLLMFTKARSKNATFKDQVSGNAGALEQNEPEPGTSHINRSPLCESPNRVNDASLKPISRSVVSETPGGSSLLFSQHEDVILEKYSGLFSFTFDKSINDQSTILLILSCQMNALRCWIEVLDGRLIWHLPALLANPGNFVDWCIHLRNIDEALAKKYFDTLYRQLSRASCKLPTGG